MAEQTEITLEAITDAAEVPDDSPERKYEIIEALVGAEPGTQVHAWGDNHAETIVHAAHALYDYMIPEMSKVVVENKWSFTLKNHGIGSSMEKLINDFLTKLLLSFEASPQFIGKKIRIYDVISNLATHEFSLSATIYGECLDVARHGKGGEIQAIHPHSLTFRSNEFPDGAYPLTGISDLLITRVHSAEAEAN
jgi:SHS2 domain-containing protein